MNKYIIERVISEANYIIDTKQTIRDIAKKYGVSKSTVHKDLQDRLLEIDLKKHELVDEIFNEHISVRHINGGESTKRKYLKI